MSLKSFRDARAAFKTNLTNVLSKLNYTPASLSMKLNNAAMNGGSTKSVINASDVQDWTSGKKVPSLYAYFKLCDYLRVNMDELVDPNFNLSTVIGRSFANQMASAPKIATAKTGKFETVTPSPEDLAEQKLIADCRNTSVGDIVFPYTKTEYGTLATEELEYLKPYAEPVKVTALPAKTKVAPVKVPSIGKVKSAAQLRTSLVDKHSTSTKRNDKLAYAVLTSGKTVADVAKALGIAPRTLRDYMYYGVTVPEMVAYKLLRVLKTCNYATLGLKFDTVKSRYTHV